MRAGLSLPAVREERAVALAFPPGTCVTVTSPVRECAGALREGRMQRRRARRLGLVRIGYGTSDRVVGAAVQCVR